MQKLLPAVCTDDEFISEAMKSTDRILNHKGATGLSFLTIDGRKEGWQNVVLRRNPSWKNGSLRTSTKCRQSS
jgi:hypothetical protein